MFMIHPEAFEVPLDHLKPRSVVTQSRLLQFFGYGFTDLVGPRDYNTLTLHEGIFDVVNVYPYGYTAGGDGYDPMPMVGDSGGPAFAIDFVNSNGFGRVLAGVDSYGVVVGGGQDPSYVYQVSIAPIASWIERTISDSFVTDPGWGTSAYGDVNEDHVLDYCRIVGVWGSQFLACQYGMFNESSNGWPSLYHRQPYAFRSPVGVAIDPGYGGTGYMKDANGDGRVDYCRTVGNPGQTFDACVLAYWWGFSSSNQYYTPAPPR
jgi:hypothetical protein